MWQIFAAQSMQALLGILKSKWFWIAIFIIIASLVARKYWWKVEEMFARPDVSDPGESISNERKEDLKLLAQLIFEDLETTFWITPTENIKTASQLTDVELLYLAKFYKKYITRGKSLRKDVDEEMFSLSDKTDVTLIARLSKLGEL